jgi:hypothetical protein
MRLPCMFWLKDNTRVDVDDLGDGCYQFSYTFLDEETEVKSYPIRKTASGMEFRGGKAQGYEQEALAIFCNYFRIEAEVN